MNNAGDRECGRLLTHSPRPPPFEMNALNHNGAWAAQTQSPCAAAYRAVPAARGWCWLKQHKLCTVDGWMETNTVHGPLVQSRVAAAIRAVPANLREDPGAHGNEQGGNAKQNGGWWTWAVGMALQR